MKTHHGKNVMVQNKPWGCCITAVRGGGITISNTSDAKLIIKQLQQMIYKEKASELSNSDTE
ncbi:hypothetical protein N9924_00615 [bacterium]|nr:hypothetical protein [bacterium]